MAGARPSAAPFPSPQQWDLLCSCSERNTRASLQEAVRQALACGIYISGKAGRLFLSPVGFRGPHRRERELLRSVGCWRGFSLGGIGRGRWAHDDAVLKQVLGGWFLLVRSNAKGSQVECSVPRLSPVSEPRTETNRLETVSAPWTELGVACSVAVLIFGMKMIPPNMVEWHLR